MSGEHQPEYSRDYGDGPYPSVACNVGVGRTLARGSFVELTLSVHLWSETSDHLIVAVSLYPACYLAVPASILGRLLPWLRDRADPPRHPWHAVRFWLLRTQEDEWIWFMGDSPESYAHLPWKRAEGERMMSQVMDL